MAHQDRVLKQQFLRQEILEQGYDAEDFQVFCQNYDSEKADDVDLWPYQQLVNLVYKFKQSQDKLKLQQQQQTSLNPFIKYEEPNNTIKQQEENKKKIQDQKQSAQQMSNDKIDQIIQRQQNKYLGEESEEQKKQEKNNNNKIKINNNPQQIIANTVTTNNNNSTSNSNQNQNNSPQRASQSQGFDIKQKVQGEDLSKTDYNCIKMQTNQLYEFKQKHPETTIISIVSDFQIKEGGLFGANYAVFKVQTSPLNWDVIRRFTDFAWLRSILSKMFPGHYVPPLPKKKAIKSLDNIYLTKRKKIFDNFVNTILKCPILSASSYVDDFLSIKEEAQFETKKKQAENLSGPKKIDEFQTFTGKINVKIDNDIKNYSTQFNMYINNLESTYSLIKKNSKQLFLDFDNLSASLLKIGDNFAHLAESTQMFNKSTPIGKVDYMENMYVILNNYCINWGNFITEQTEAVKDAFHEFFRFQTKNNKVIKELAKNRSNLSNLFTDSIRRLEEKKDKIFSQNDISKWEIPASLLTNSKNLQNNKVEAFKVMLPQDTEQVNNHGIYSGAINQLFLEQSSLFLKIRHHQYGKKHLQFTHQMAKNIADQHHQLAETMSYLSLQVGLQVNSLNQSNRGDQNDNQEDYLDIRQSVIKSPDVKKIIRDQPQDEFNQQNQQNKNIIKQKSGQNSQEQQYNEVIAIDFEEVDEVRIPDKETISMVEDKYTKKFNDKLKQEKEKEIQQQLQNQLKQGGAVTNNQKVIKF